MDETLDHLRQKQACAFDFDELKANTTNNNSEALKSATHKRMQHLDSLPPEKACAKSENMQLTDNFNQDDNINFCQVSDTLSETSRRSSKVPSDHVLSPIAFKPSVPHSELIFSHPSKKDFERMDIVNRFISAYTRGTSPLDIMNILIKMYPPALTFKTQVKQTSDKQKFYIMDVIVSRLFSCQAGSRNELEVRNKVLLQAYSTLKKFAQLFVHFKLSYSGDKSPLKIVDELVEQNSEMIQLQVKMTTEYYRTLVTIKYIAEFSVSDTDKDESKLAASMRAVNILVLLSDRLTKEGLQRLHNDRTSGALLYSTPSSHGPSSTNVFLKPPSAGSDKNNAFSSPLDFSNDSLKQPVPLATTAVNQFRRLSQISNSTFNSNLLDNASYCTSLVNEEVHESDKTSPVKTGVLIDLSSPVSSASISQCIPLSKTLPFIIESTTEKRATELFDLPLTNQIYLLNRFNLVYSVTKTVHDIITELKGSLLDDNAIKIVINTACMAGGTFLTTVEFEDISAEFSEWANQDKDSVEKALAKAVDFLKNLAKLVVDFKSLNTLQEHPSIVIDKLRTRHPQLVTVRTSTSHGVGKPQLQYLTIIRLEHLCSFAQAGGNEAASRQAAAVDAVAYLRKLAEGVYENYKPDLPPLTINLGQFAF